VTSGDRGRGLSVRETARVAPSDVRPARDLARSGMGGTGGGCMRGLGGDWAAARRAGIDVFAPRARFRIESACVEWN
jgi:hypothetical protein